MYGALWMICLTYTFAAEGERKIAPMTIPLSQEKVIGELGPVPQSAGEEGKKVAPPIRSLVKPAVYDSVIEQRRVHSYANLESPLPNGFRKYRFYALMRVNADVKHTKKILTTYSLYKQLVPLVDRSDYDPAKKTLHLEGGIWGWMMRSWIFFRERGKYWTNFQIIRGHFSGMVGDIYYEKIPGKPATLVYIWGTLTGKGWPPDLVMERGAEIGLSQTGKQMRQVTEEYKGKEIPLQWRQPKANTKISNPSEKN